MLLKDAVRFSKMAEQNDEADLFQECHDIAVEVSKNVNQMMEAGRIENFPGDISKQVSKCTVITMG